MFRSILRKALSPVCLILLQSAPRNSPTPVPLHHKIYNTMNTRIAAAGLGVLAVARGGSLYFFRHSRPPGPLPKGLSNTALAPAGPPIALPRPASRRHTVIDTGN